MGEEQGSGRRSGRRRRANIEGPTLYVRVSMSEAERARLFALEERTRRSASEILVSGALYARNAESLAERRALASELMAARRYLAALSNNVNQLARRANATDEFPEEARVALARVRVIAERINGLVEGLGR
ncbi:plasmid mobilization relaxosome protein MobC [Sinomonas humi]|uniref:Mobilization protein n=1 Tax=Sinomonas humi TaxID=1338436 RepID=A0A0B2AQ54_9MICC|nr:plasmid mobilization relaxosome protein MobC [Sinomonas humi]KHL04104.1 mobilization protein [Sinomonas humi]